MPGLSLVRVRATSGVPGRAVSRGLGGSRSFLGAYRVSWVYGLRLGCSPPPNFSQSLTGILVGVDEGLLA